MDGILNILKPPGMTSHDVVSRVRKIVSMKKVGHTGTLDPNAAGVLPICVGQATKISQFLLDSQKKYRAQLCLGVETDTQDRYGTILSQNPVQVSPEEIKRVIYSFLGESQQIPPMYSAIKQNGKKLYELARAGIEVQREPRSIVIEDIQILDIQGNTVLMDVTCSKGTYIRTLCKDIGERLACGAMMSFLLRTATGSFTLEDTITLDELNQLSDFKQVLYPVDYPLHGFPALTLHQDIRKAAYNGNKIAQDFWLNDPSVPLGSLVRVYLDNTFIGLAEVKSEGEKQYIKFSRMFI